MNKIIQRVLLYTLVLPFIPTSLSNALPKHELPGIYMIGEKSIADKRLIRQHSSSSQNGYYFPVTNDKQFIARLTIFSDGSYVYEEYPDGKYVSNPASPNRCKGRYFFNGRFFAGVLDKCESHRGLPVEIRQKIDFARLRLDQLKEGTTVNIQSSIFRYATNESLTFGILKVDSQIE